MLPEPELAPMLGPLADPKLLGPVISVVGDPPAYLSPELAPPTIKKPTGATMAAPVELPKGVSKLVLSVPEPVATTLLPTWATVIVTLARASCGAARSAVRAARPQSIESRRLVEKRM
jgi:hypothetical protein